MRKVGLTVALLALFVGGSLVNQAEARPDYHKAFVEAYPSVKDAASAKCGVCHFGEKKSNRNDYGEAMGKALGAKNVKNMDDIKASLKKIETEKSKDGKTFGELLKEGKLPGTNP